MTDAPADPAPAAEPHDHPSAPERIARVALSGLEIDALARMDAAYRNALASIVASRGESPSGSWREERDEHGRIVAFVRATENGA